MESSPSSPVSYGLPPSAAHLAQMQQRRADLARELIAVLGSRQSFVWEVGSGHGHFLTALATARPDRLFIGVDIASDRVARAERKRDRAGLTNLHFLRADALLFLDVLGDRARIEDTFVLFPDPWPKARHHKNRIMQVAFLDKLAMASRPSSLLCFRTDHAPYFEEAHAAVAAHPRWELTAEAWPFEHQTVFQSRAPEYQSLTARRRA